MAGPDCARPDATTPGRTAARSRHLSDRPVFNHGRLINSAVVPDATFATISDDEADVLDASFRR
jgi:hypothetical protein